MFLMGGGVNGGKVYGDWPTLDKDKLYGPGDLAVTTDFRDVLGRGGTKAAGEWESGGGVSKLYHIQF